MANSRDESSDEDLWELWPENEQIHSVFIAVQTNWTMLETEKGYRRIGIPVPAIESAINLLRIPESEIEKTFRGVRVMEVAALEAMSKEK